MISILRGAEREQRRGDGIVSLHSFHAGSGPESMAQGYSCLQTFNEISLEPGQRLREHQHQNLELLTLVLDGALLHRDSLGNECTVLPGEVQRLIAGSGISHSETNASHSDRVTFLQTQISSGTDELDAAYDCRYFPDDLKETRLCLLAGPDGADDSLRIGGELRLYATTLRKWGTVIHRLAEGRCAYVHVTRGEISANADALRAGDGATIEAEDELRIAGLGVAEVLLFDLPAP